MAAAILPGQLGGLPPAALVRMRGIARAFALCFGAITLSSWRYLFLIPIAFSLAVTAALNTAAWLVTKHAAGPEARP